MSARMPWFRMYVDFLNDPKLIRLAFEDQRHFIGVLALKSDGALDGDTDPELLDRIVAQRLWIDHAVIREVKKRLMKGGLIGDGWQPLGWDKRQFPSDSSKARVAKFRAKKNAEKSADECCNDDETLQQRPSNAVDTDTDTDTDKEETVKELETESANDANGAAPAAPPQPKQKRAARLPDDWKLPKSWGDWALAEFPAMTREDVRSEADAFADYWHAEGGQKARKLDWAGTWRNWIRRSAGVAERRAVSRGTYRPPSQDPDTPTETYTQRAARQRMEEVAPMAARKVPGGSSFEAAQRFMRGGNVTDVDDATPRLVHGGAE